MRRFIFTICNVGLGFAVYRIATQNIPIALGLATFVVLYNIDRLEI